MVIELAHHTVVAGGTRTAYIEAGNPEAPTIVFMHDGAFGATAEICWGDVMTRLATDFHVVAPDLQGWGGTDKVVYLDRSPYAGRIAHIRAFCEALNIERAHFAGVSFGGSMLMRAMTMPENSLPFDRVVSIAGAGGAFREAAGMAALGEYNPSVEDARRVTELLVTDTAGLDDNIQARYEASIIPGHWEAMMAPRLSNPAIKSERPADTFFDDLAVATVPTLLIEGSADPLMETGWAAKTAGNNPHFQTLVVEYGHEPNLEAPEWTAQTLRQFFGPGA